MIPVALHVQAPWRGWHCRMGA